MPIPSSVAGDYSAVVPDRARPFLKWAGGKRQLLPELRRFIPREFGRYFEPFLGSGAFFFDLAGADKIDGRHASLTDVNRDLLGTYRAVATDVEAVIAQLIEHERRHNRAGQEHFYRVRDRLFNPQRGPRVGAVPTVPVEDYSPTLAAMFIYLNRTGFNGLYRLNSKGEFNVPIGRYSKPKICDAENLRAVSALISSPNVKIDYCGFECALDQAIKGDLLYFDPPYAPVSDTANFTGYTAFGFSRQDQSRLQQIAIELANRGCNVVVSNSTADIIVELYDKSTAARAAGLRVHTVSARRAINSKATHRGDVSEFIISNVVPTE